MDQALPPLFVRAGQRSYVDYCAEGGRSLGTRLYTVVYMAEQSALFREVVRSVNKCFGGSSQRRRCVRDQVSQIYASLVDLIIISVF